MKKTNLDVKSKQEGKNLSILIVCPMARLAVMFNGKKVPNSNLWILLLGLKWETHRDRSSDVNDLGYIPVQRSRENATTNDNEIITYVLVI